MTTEIQKRLAAIGTPTLSSQLIKHGLRQTYLSGPRRLVGQDAVCGPAFTLRFVPARDDKAVPIFLGLRQHVALLDDGVGDGEASPSRVLRRGQFGRILRLSQWQVPTHH